MHSAMKDLASVIRGSVYAPAFKSESSENLKLKLTRQQIPAAFPPGKRCRCLMALFLVLPALEDDLEARAFL